MEAYKPYVEYLTAGGVAETAYLLSHQGAVCATNLPIQQLPSYNFALEDEKDPNIKHNIVVNEAEILADIVSQIGVGVSVKSKFPAGLRLYNQKYYIVRHDADKKVVYIKKVRVSWFRKTEEDALPRRDSSSSLAHGMQLSPCKIKYLKTLENWTSEWKI